MKPLNRSVIEYIAIAFILFIPLRAYGNELIHAALDGDTSTVRSLINQSVNVDKTNENGATALLIATWKGHTEIVNLLRKAGARE